MKDVEKLKKIKFDLEFIMLQVKEMLGEVPDSTSSDGENEEPSEEEYQSSDED